MFGVLTNLETKQISMIRNRYCDCIATSQIVGLIGEIYNY